MRSWINPGFQVRFLLRIGSYFLLYLFVIWHLGFLFSLGCAFVANQARTGIAELYVAYLWDLRPLVFAATVVAPYVINDLIKFSHRVAGPLHRCRNMMRDMAAGKAVPQFYPRKHDLMPEFFEDFNALVKTCNGRTTTGSNGHSPVANLQETPTEQVHSLAACNTGQGP